MDADQRAEPIISGARSLKPDRGDRIDLRTVTFVRRLLSGLEHGAVVRILGPYIVSGGW